MLPCQGDVVCDKLSCCFISPRVFEEFLTYLSHCIFELVNVQKGLSVTSVSLICDELMNQTYLSIFLPEMHFYHPSQHNTILSSLLLVFEIYF